MQEKYWNFMKQIKFAIFYLDLYADNAYKKDMAIKIISAIASSASIAAWAIWQDYSYIWSFIIAVFQVLTAVKGYLPYNIILKSIASCQKDLKLLFSDIEHDWYYIASGDKEESEINELLFLYKKRYIEAETLIFESSIFLKKKHLATKSDKQTDLYFKNNYSNSGIGHMTQSGIL